jgi:hypothetical protein
MRFECHRHRRLRPHRRRIPHARCQGQEIRRHPGRASRTKFEFVLDLKTISALGVTVLNTMLALGDEVIEWGGPRFARFTGVVTAPRRLSDRPTCFGSNYCL